MFKEFHTLSLYKDIQPYVFTPSNKQRLGEVNYIAVKFMITRVRFCVGVMRAPLAIE